MSAPSSSEVTGLLRAWGRGDEEALQKLMPLVYDQLHAAARRYMAGERAGHTLQTTALIHETYLRLIDIRQVEMAGTRSLFCRLRAAHAPDPDRFRALARYQKHGGAAPHVNCPYGRGEPEYSEIPTLEHLSQDRRSAPVAVGLLAHAASGKVGDN